MTYDVELRVLDNNRKRVVAHINQLPGDGIRMTIDKIEAVAKDKPKFAKDGVITMEYHRKDHVAKKIEITKYLKDLFAKESANADTDTSVKKS